MNVRNDEGIDRVIRLSNDDKIRIEHVTEFVNSIFNDQYKRGYKIVDEIIRNSEKESQDIRSCGNIIAFLGERGSGKSSAMNSFAKALVQYEYSRCTEDFYVFYEDELNKVKRKVKFTPLANFDAASLEKGEDIFDNVLSQMFARFEEMLNEQWGESDHKEFWAREIQQDFARIFTDFQNLNHAGNGDVSYEGVALASLKYYSTSSEVCRQFANLVEKYRNLLRRGCQDKPYLVLTIDDMDMNINHGFHILGQIERYLTVPGIIILIAASYEQLEILGERDYINMFPTINKDMKNSQIAYARRTAREYLEKALPIQHRIYMPAFYNVLSEFPKSLLVEAEQEVIKKTLLGKIARRTEVYFDGLGMRRHFLEANSLRGLNDYYSFLNELVKLRECGEHELISYMSYNQDRFLQDISYRFIFQYLTEKQRVVFRNLCNIDDREKNSYLIYYIKKCLENQCIEWEEESCSYGEMLYGLYLFSRNESKNKRLGHCVLIVYSFLLNRCIREDKRSEEKNSAAERTLARVLGDGITGAWGEDIFPYLRYGTEHRQEDTNELYYLGSARKVSLHSKNIYWFKNTNRILKGTDAAMISEWFETHCDFLVSFEMLMFFWENLLMEKGAETGYHKIAFSWEDLVLDDGNIFNRISLINDSGDFNILSFIMNSFHYKDFFSKIHDSLIEAINPGLTEEEKRKVKQKMQEVGMYAQYSEWEKLYETRAALPFQHTDVYYHMLDRMKRIVGWKIPQVIRKEDVLIYLNAFYSEISNQMKSLDDFYQHGEKRPRFKETYENCPFIKNLLQWELNDEVTVLKADFNKESIMDNMQKEADNPKKRSWMSYEVQLASVMTECALTSKVIYNKKDVLPEEEDV